jgi:hypothetical protein
MNDGQNKLLKYPNLICGFEVSITPDRELFLDIIKPFRDSLVHPSPFSAPERVGGHDKLRKIYDLDQDIAIQAVEMLVEIIENIYELIHGSGKKPVWLKKLKEKTSQYKVAIN